MPDLINVNQRDVSLEVYGALPAGASTSVTIGDLVLGNVPVGPPYAGDFALPSTPGGRIPDRIEIELAIPALSSAIVPNGSTVTVVFNQGAAANPNTAASESFVFTGAGGNGVAAQRVRFKPMPNGGAYVNATVTFGASCTSGAALQATLSPIF